ncbi:MAG: ChaN family lipoprotein [Saprospiraceae bacterium]|nr:ChaN family lipoprotein [Saprospiraceae bacterium]
MKVTIRKICFSILFACSFLPLLQSQSMPAYQLFDKKGKKVSYEKMLKALEKSDVLLFGELHNNPIVHWLQYEVTDTMKGKRKLILGAEMIETDNQAALNKYLAGEIDQKGLDSTARLWNNYKTDYKPLVDLAKKHNLNFVGTNIPRKYASKVYRGGFESLDSLPEPEKLWIAPLPIEYDPDLPGYKNMLTMMADHANENFPKAQAIKDATMAHNILKNYHAGSLFIHYNGAYHSDNYEGILWYLKNDRPDLKYTTISVHTQKELKKLDKDVIGKADFIICVHENMTTTY